MFTTKPPHPIRLSTFPMTIWNHQPAPFVMSLDGKDLHEMPTVEELLAFVRGEHEARCSCKLAKSSLPLSPQVWLRDHSTGDDRRFMPVLFGYQKLSADSLYGKRDLQFILELQNIVKRPRSISPADKLQLRLAAVTHFVFRVAGRKMPRASLGDGDWYSAAETPGTTVFDTTVSLGDFGAGSLLRSDSKLSLMFASPSPYMTAHVSTLLSYFHDLDRSGDWATFCQPLSMVQVATNASVPISHSAHVCLTLDFSDWAEPLRKIPDAFVMPAVPERPESFEKCFIRHIRRAIRQFMSTYRSYLTPSDLTPSDRFRFAQSSQIVPQFLLWLKQHAPGHRLFIVVRNIECALGRPIRASIWQGYEAYSVERRAQFARERLVDPIWTDYLRDDGVLQKILFTGSYLPDWLRTGAGSAGGQIIDLASVDSLGGLSALHLEGGFKPIRSSPDHLKHCNVLCNVPSVHGPVQLYSPESALAVAPGLDALAVEESKRRVDSDQKEPIVCGSFVTDYRFESAAAMLFPLFLREAAALPLLDTLFSRDGRLHLPDVAPTPARLAASGIIGGSSPQQLFVTRGMILGLLVCEGPSMAYKIAGTCAKLLLLRVKKEIQEYPRKVWVRPRRHRYIGGKVDPPLRIPAEDTAMLDLDDITERALADMVLLFYHPSRAGKHPYNQPMNEHGFQGDFVSMICAAHLRASGKNFTSDVQDEVTLYCWVVDHVESGRLDVLYLRLLPDGTYKLYIFELKYFHPMHTAHATHANVAGLPSAAVADQYFEFYAKFREVLDSIVVLPPHWYRGDKRIGATLPTNLRMQDIRCNYEINSQPKKPKRSGGAPVAGSTATSSKAKATRSKKEPIVYRPPKEFEVKDPITIMEGGVDQALKYRDAAAHGVRDAVPVAAPTVPGSDKPQPGLADWRITDMGPGRTEIVPFVVVNVAGTIAGVQKLPSTVLDRKLGFVNAYTWTGTRTETQVQAMYNAIKAYKPPTD